MKQPIDYVEEILRSELEQPISDELRRNLDDALGHLYHVREQLMEVGPVVEMTHMGLDGRIAYHAVKCNACGSVLREEGKIPCADLERATKP